MKEINFPCETAVIFRDTIFLIRLQGKSDLCQQMEMATGWFKRWFSAPEDEVKAALFVSFGGLYLDYKQTMERAA
ncbi:hypothetical protein [Sodalis ligni]|uniref:Uncharacterized protein n=1 Tax=Sodalis ligni TaxID=2697027 RepID=A0A4R1NH13_9GAMM|nr:hypothetical protein [Sodalis ligni]TCL06872.1 hypothetical protein EZJ58_5169 [Sodalis ligni]